MRLPMVIFCEPSIVVRSLLTAALLAFSFPPGPLAAFVRVPTQRASAFTASAKPSPSPMISPRPPPAAIPIDRPASIGAPAPGFSISPPVVATVLTANASDQGELPVLLDTVEETFDAQPATVLADAGYCNEWDLTDLEERGVDGYVAPGRDGKQAATRNLEKHPATGRMVEKLATPAGRAVYAQRKWLSEAPYGWIKHVLGFLRFSLRGLAKVRGEWDLVCLALNVKRLHVLMAA